MKSKNLKSLIPLLESIDKSALSMHDQKIVLQTIEVLDQHTKAYVEDDILKNITAAIDNAFLKNVGRPILLSKQSTVLISKNIQDFISEVESIPTPDYRDRYGKKLKDVGAYINLYILAHQLKHVAEDKDVLDLPVEDNVNVGT
jgi:hypothetical protein